MINHSKSILALINTKQGAQDFKIEQDVTDMTADDMVEIFVKMMEYQGYNDISIWRALVTAADEMVEKFDNIIETKEWQNEKKTVQSSTTVFKDVVVSITCNSCGETADGDDIGFTDIQPFEFYFGFGSKKDGETWRFDLCDNCADKIIKNFKHKPDVEEY
jgi:hypothetical protein